jgi:hypothetical protein
MAAFERSTLCVLVVLPAASPAAANTPRDGLRRPPPRSLTVRRRRGRSNRNPAATLGIAVASGLLFETPFTLVAGTPDRLVRLPHDIGPDGAHGSQADLVRSIENTPCGQACTRRSLERWSYAPADRRLVR